MQIAKQKEHETFIKNHKSNCKKFLVSYIDKEHIKGST